MHTATIEIPAALSVAVAESLGEQALPRWMSEAIVLQGVREGLLSIGEAGEALGLGYFTTEALIKRKGAFPEMTEQDLAQDEADLLEIVARAYDL